MKNIIAKTLLITAGLVMFQQAVEASSLTSRIATLRLNKTTDSPARTSIQMFGASGPCLSGWYAFENAHTGLGKNWQDALVAAVKAGKTVTVAGTGICDRFNIEKIEFIDFK